MGFYGSFIGSDGNSQFFPPCVMQETFRFSIALLGAGEPRSGSGLFSLTVIASALWTFSDGDRGGFTWMDVSSTSDPSDGSCRRRDNVATSFYFSYGHIRRYHGVSLPASAFLGCICHQNVKKKCDLDETPPVCGCRGCGLGFPVLNTSFPLSPHASHVSCVCIKLEMWILFAL